MLAILILMSKPKVKMLSVKEVVEKTGIPISTVNLYCRNKKFPNAKKKHTEFGDFWQIPETDLELISKRGRGRPKTKKEQ